MFRQNLSERHGDERQRLMRPGLTQLGQRIAVRARLDSLPPAEVVRYMNHRLHVAGYPGSQLFTREASAAVAEHSRGIPRLINHLEKTISFLHYSPNGGRRARRQRSANCSANSPRGSPTIWCPTRLPRRPVRTSTACSARAPG